MPTVDSTVTGPQQWIYDQLTGDAQLMAVARAVTFGPAAAGTPYPFVRFDVQSPPRVVRGVGMVEIMSDGLWLVRGIDQQNSTMNLATISARIQALLAGYQNVTIAAGTILSSVREDAFSLEPVEGGRQYRHLGGIYRIQFQ